MQNKKRVTVIGGGFSGLVQAYYLLKAGYQVKIIEKKDRLGGLLGSETKGEFLMEQAANGFLANLDLENMSHDIGVPLVEKQKVARKRYIFRDGVIKRWPLSLKGSLPLLGFLIKRKWKNRAGDNESLKDWGHRILGKEVTQYLLEPAMQGVYASLSENLNASLILESLNKKTNKGTLRGSVAPVNGMGQWIDGLAKYLKSGGVEFEFGNTLNIFDLSEPVIFAVDLMSLKKMATEGKLGLHPSIEKTQSVSLTSVTIGVSGQESPFPQGFGCLFPKKENFHSLGVLFNHCIFPGRLKSGFSETWILNDDQIEFSKMSSTALLRYILSDRIQMKSEWVEPTEVKISQWSQKIPIYNNSLKEFLQNQSQEKTPFLLMGNYLGDLGLSKLLYRAQENVEKIEGGYFG